MDSNHTWKFFRAGGFDQVHIDSGADLMALDELDQKFFRAGGFDQVHIDSGADLMALDELDQKLWVALACPTTGLEFDAKTLALIDTDKDGRIRAPELISAVKWAGACLKNPDDLLFIH